MVLTTIELIINAIIMIDPITIKIGEIICKNII